MSKAAPAEASRHVHERPSLGRSTQEARRAASDRRLIAAGIRLVALRGVAGTSLAQVGETAGYSRGLAAERFGSKQRFLEAVVDHMETWFRRRLADRMQGQRGIAAIEARVAQHLDGAVDATEATRALYHLYTDALGVAPGLLPRMVALSRAFHAGFAAAVADAQVLGEIEPRVDAERQATLTVATVRGIALQFLLDGDEARLRGAERHLVAQLRRTLRGATK